MLRRDLEFVCALVNVGLLAGFAGVATTLVLRSVEQFTYHYTFGSLLAGVTASNPVRRVLGPMAGGVLAALGWWMLRSRTDVPRLADVIVSGGRVPRPASVRCIPSRWAALCSSPGSC